MTYLGHKDVVMPWFETRRFETRRVARAVLEVGDSRGWGKQDNNRGGIYVLTSSTRGDGREEWCQPTGTI